MIYSLKTESFVRAIPTCLCHFSETNRDTSLI